MTANEEKLRYHPVPTNTTEVPKLISETTDVRNHDIFSLHIFLPAHTGRK